MSELYNEQYYHNDCGPVSYDNTEVWMLHFEYLAERLIAEFKPKTVLDAGCAMGYLVAALRDKGVEAYGIDISDYAISRVRSDIKPFCKVGSLTDQMPADFPHFFDLIVSIEVLEHLSPSDGSKAISNLCAHTDTVLFSSTPDDFEEKTHINVQPAEYWAKEFYNNQFHNIVLLQPDYIAEHAVCFKKLKNPMSIIDEYEKGVEYLRKRIKEETAETSRQLNNALDQIEKTKAQITKVQERDEEILKLHEQLNKVNSNYLECKNAKDYWEMEFHKIDKKWPWKALKKIWRFGK